MYFAAYDCNQKLPRSRSGPKRKMFHSLHTTSEVIYTLTCRYLNQKMTWSVHLCLLYLQWFRKVFKPLKYFGYALVVIKTLLLFFCHKSHRAHCAQWNIQSFGNGFIPFPKYLLTYLTICELLRLHGLVYSLTCSASCGILYMPVCAFLSQVQFVEFSTHGLQSGSRDEII